MPNSKIRREAKKVLKGNWLKLGLIIVFFVLIISAISTATNPKKFLDESLCRLVDFNNISSRDESKTMKESIAYIVGVVLQAFMTVGLCTVLINLVQGKKYVFTMLFRDVKTGLKAIALGFVMTVFIALWFFVFIIPGIIKIFSYSMSFYVLAQNPEKSILECITESREMMDGNKFKLFCLEFYFKACIAVALLLLSVPFVLGRFMIDYQAMQANAIGAVLESIVVVVLIAVMTFGLSYFCIYSTVSEAVFYMSVSGQEHNISDMQE